MNWIMQMNGARCCRGVGRVAAIEGQEGARVRRRLWPEIEEAGAVATRTIFAAVAARLGTTHAAVGSNISSAAV